MSDAHAVHDASRPPFLAHHFDTPTQQFRAGKLGMWLFLATEILMFSGLFCAYAVYRHNHPEIFFRASKLLDWRLGALNTLILISSSLTMAWAVHAAQNNQQKRLVQMLTLTLVFACGFLVVKGIEYNEKWKHHLLPGTAFKPEIHATEGHSAESAAPVAAAPGATPAQTADAAKSATTVDPTAYAGPAPGAAPTGLSVRGGETSPANEKLPSYTHIFFGIYFVMTGLHGLHVLIGMGVIGWVLMRARRGEFSSEYNAPVDLVGLYWHLVDVIWIYLFPLLYLVR